MVKLNGVSQPILTEYKMVHDLNQACLKPKISKTWQSLILPVFNYVLEQVSVATLNEKKNKQKTNWIISVTANQK